MPVLSKNCTNVSDMTTIRNSTLSRLDENPSRNAPTSGIAGIDTRESGTAIIPNTIPTTAVAIIPKKIAPVTFLA